MSIKFKKLTVKNFLSIGPQVEFDFSTHNGLNYVFGYDKDIPGTKNGIGKSLIFVDSILYILYGTTSKNINKKYLINRQINKTDETELTLLFLLRDKEYFIRTGITKPLTTCASFFELFEVKEDGSRILIPSKSSIDETRKNFINEYLKIPYIIFKNSIILSSRNTQDFFSMEKAQKRDFIENIFNLNQLGIILKNTRSDQNKLSKEILTIQTIIKQLNTDIEKFIVLNKNFNTDKQEYIDKLNTNINKIQKEKDETITIIEDNKKILNNIKLLDKVKLTEKLNTLEDKLKELNNIKQKAQHEIDKILSILNNNKNILNIICNSCKDKVLEELKLKNNECIIKEYNNTIIHQEQNINLLSDGLNKINKLIRDNDNKCEEIRQINNTIEYNTEKIKTIDNNITKLTEQLKEKTNEISQFNILINDYNIQLNKNTEILNTFLKTKKYLDIIEHIVSEDGVKKTIITDLIHILNDKIKFYLSKTNALYTCIFDDNFNSEFITVTGPCSFSNFSTGEQARINICILFAFKDILVELRGIQSSILIIDEFLDNGLCQQGIESVIEIIKTLIKSNNQTVFLISHRDNLDESNFDNIIELEKKNGFTQIYKDVQGGINAAI